MSLKLLIQIVVGVLGAAVIAALGVGLASSWRVAERSERQLQITSVIREAFEALTTVRFEVTVLTTQWHEPAPATPDQRAQEARSYGLMNAASRRTIESVRATAFDRHEALAIALENSFGKLDAVHADFLRGVELRGAERRGNPSDVFFAEGEAFQRTLQEIVGTAVNEAKRTDNVISQLYELHELAWQLREAAGQAYRVLSLAFRGQLPPPDIARASYASANDVLAVLWTSVQNAARSSALPDGLRESIDAGRAAFFASDLVDRNQRTFDAIVAGRVPELTAAQWSDLNRQRLGIPERVAVAALDLAADHAVAVRAAARWDLRMNAALLLGALVFTLGAMTVVNRRLLKPLLTLRDAMLDVADGNLAADTPFTARRDEIGALAGALRVFRQSALDLREAAAAQAAERDAKSQRMLRLETLVHGFEATMAHLSEHIGVSSTQLEATARVLSLSNRSTSAGAEKVDAAGCEASASAQTVAAATEELSASISVVRSSVEKSSVITAQAVEDVCRSEQIVRALTERADRIGAVVGLIQNIAGQTNLLALNATIEAARAGDAGKGFAVVASEVKGLATQTAKATAEIGLQIDEIQAATRQAAEAFRGITSTIEGISAIAASIAGAVQQQGAATSEIARTVQQTAAAAQAINAHIATVSDAAQGTDTAAGHVLGAAGDLSQQAERLATEVLGFTRAVRAA